MHESDAVTENRERDQMQNGFPNLNSMTHDPLLAISFTCCLLRCNKWTKGQTVKRN